MAGEGFDNDALKELNEYDVIVSSQYNSAKTWGISPDEAQAQVCGCKISRLRNLLIGVNVFFLLIGAGVLVAGYYTYSNEDTFLVSGSSLTLGIIILGAAIIFIAFIGLCGSWSRSRLLLVFYEIILIILVAAQGLVFILLFLRYDIIQSTIIDAWASGGVQFEHDTENSLTCCGLVSFNDTHRTDPSFPCPVNSDSGCLQSLEDQFQANFVVTVSIIGVALFIQLFGGILLGLSLLTAIQRSARGDGDFEANSVSMGNRF